MHRIVRSVLLVALFAGLAGNLHAQGVSFEPGVEYFAGIGPWSVAVGDFNGDGIPDLAVADYSFPPSQAPSRYCSAMAMAPFRRQGTSLPASRLNP